MGYFIYRDDHAPHSYGHQFCTCQSGIRKETAKLRGHHGSPGHISLEGFEPWIQNPPLPFPHAAQLSPAGWTFQASRDKGEAIGPPVSQQGR